MPYERRKKKLQDKSAAMIMVGYHPTRAYRFYNTVTNKIYISRDVVLDEENSWDWTNLNGDLGSHSVSVVIGNGKGNSGGNQENYGGIQGDDTMHVKQQTQRETRQPRQRRLPWSLVDFEVYPDNAVNDEGDLVHFALLEGCNVGGTTFN